MSHRLRAVTCSLLLAVAAFALAPRPASAHPMGNFTINHYSALTVTSSRVDLRYVLDMAEIPTFAELQTISPTAAPSSARRNRPRISTA